MEFNHGCKFGLGIGDIHPDMNPLFLINDVFWTEPEDNSDHESDQEERVAKDLRTLREIRHRYQNELNGEGTSRIPLIENQDKPHIGKRFRHNY